MSDKSYSILPVEWRTNVMIKRVKEGLYSKNTLYKHIVILYTKLNIYDTKS